MAVRNPRKALFQAFTSGSNSRFADSTGPKHLPIRYRIRPAAA
jgi:hypothetical protein